MSLDPVPTDNAAMDDWSDWALPRRRAALLAEQEARDAREASVAREARVARPAEALPELSIVPPSIVPEAGDSETDSFLLDLSAEFTGDLSDNLDDLDLDDQEYFARLDRRFGKAGERTSSFMPAATPTSNGTTFPLQVEPAAVEAPPSKSQQAAAIAPATSRGIQIRRIGFRVILGAVMCFVLLVGFVFVRLNQTKRIEETIEFDLPGTPTLITTVTTLPGPIDSSPPSTTPEPTTPNSTIVSPTPNPSPTITTIPGEGSCEDDPACAAAPVVVLPEIEKPKANRLLIDPLDIEPLGGVDALNTLIIGTDSRANIDPAQEATFGKVGGSRSDTIMVLRNDGSGKEAGILSFPRDLYVHIAGANKNDRINAAYGGGANRLVKTIQENFGVPIHHTVEVDFGGFQKVVGTLGGVNICFDKASRDKESGLNQPAGCNLLDQAQATAYVRSRHLEVEVSSGEWKPDGKGDLGRVQRQQYFIKRVLQRAIDAGGRNPITANALVSDLQKAIRIDKEYSTGDLLGLAKTFRAFEPDELQLYTIETDYARIDGKAVLRVKRAESSEIVALFGRR